MKAASRFLVLVAIGGAAALAACGGESPTSPAGPTAAAATSDDAVVTSSGHGPGAPQTAAGAGTGTGTCTSACDGTAQGPGPGAGHGYGYGTPAGGGTGNGFGPGPGPSDGFCGTACAGPVGPDPADVGTLLAVALQEEYKAEMLYRSVLGTFGPDTAPFALVAEAEARHVEAIQALFTRRQLAPPPSAWAPSSFAPFASVALACAGGVDAETEDATFYTPYLQRTDLPEDVRNVFTNLQRASLEAHLPAFEHCR